MGQLTSNVKIRRFQVRVCLLNSETPVLSSLTKCWCLASFSAGEESEGFLSGETDQSNKKCVL